MCRGQKRKETHFVENLTKHLVGSHDKNGEDAIFRTRDEGTSNLVERYNAGNDCRSKKKRNPRIRWMDDIKSVTGLSVND